MASNTDLSPTKQKRTAWEEDKVLKYYLDNPKCTQRMVMNEFGYCRGTLHIHWKHIVSLAEEKKHYATLKLSSEKQVNFFNYSCKLEICNNFTL